MTRLGRIPKSANASAHRARFRILPFTNESGSRAWRVQGMTRDRRYIRENFRDLKAAQCRQIELEAEYQRRAPDDPSVRATTLSEHQVRLAEQAFAMVDRDIDVIAAITWWRQNGSQKRLVDSPRLDDAVAAFLAYVASTASLRPTYKHSLTYRVRMFASVTGNVRVADLTADHIEAFLAGRKRVSPVTKRSDLRGISRFIGWCRERPRRWITHNPAADVTVELPPTPVPEILSVETCERLLRAAQQTAGGATLPYVVVTLLAGIRPFEASRLTWANVNLADGEIRLDGTITKTGKPRVIAFNDGPPEQRPFNEALAAWLRACNGRPFAVTQHQLQTVRRAAGITSWLPDGPRHAAISHFFRLGGSYGRTAELFGNSEAIIRAHYQARVSTADSAAFYALRP